MLNCGMRVAAAGLVVGCLITLIGCGGATPSYVVITPASVLLAPGQSFQFSVVKGGSAANISQLTFLVNGVAGGSPPTGTITSGGLYTAPSNAAAQPIKVSVQGQNYSSAITIFDPSNFTPGSVAATQNPLVASYSMTVPANTAVHVQFGPDTNYGFPTSAVQSPAGGGSVTILVAGMRASATYHMQAVLDLGNGSRVLDADQTFTTGSIPADQLPKMTTQFTGVGTPSDGIDLFSLDPNQGGNQLTTVATDLDGNVIWYYALESEFWPYPIKPLSNGHMMLNASPVPAGPTGGSLSEIREIDLAGNVINTITIGQVNLALTGIASFQLQGFHHDFAVLPNGHLILLGNFYQTINGVSGIPDGSSIVGDALIDWDLQQQAAVWAWSTFDHLSLTHAPYGYPDWTHANAIIYSPDDGDLILSMRNQNWVIKINYQNGEGDGSVLWRLGPDGDFSLPVQQEPIEWNYGQHYPTIISPNSSGVFSLLFFNNGTARLMNSNNITCDSPGVGACYSSVPIFQLDESAKTATILWEDDLQPAYSICCGDALILANGNTEFDVAYDLGTPGFSHIEEVTPSRELVWKMDIQGQLAYRGFRIPSLYPGQVWPAAAASSANRVPPDGSRASGEKASSRKSVQQLP